MKSIQEAPQLDEIKNDTYLGDSSRSEYNGSGMSSSSDSSESSQILEAKDV